MSTQGDIVWVPSSSDSRNVDTQGGNGLLQPKIYAVGTPALNQPGS